MKKTIFCYFFLLLTICFTYYKPSYIYADDTSDINCNEIELFKADGEYKKGDGGSTACEDEERADTLERRTCSNGFEIAITPNDTEQNIPLTAENFTVTVTKTGGLLEDKNTKNIYDNLKIAFDNCNDYDYDKKISNSFEPELDRIDPYNFVAEIPIENSSDSPNSPNYLLETQASNLCYLPQNIACNITLKLKKSEGYEPICKFSNRLTTGKASITRVESTAGEIVCKDDHLLITGYANYCGDITYKIDEESAQIKRTKGNGDFVIDLNSTSAKDLGEHDITFSATPDRYQTKYSNVSFTVYDNINNNNNNKCPVAPEGELGGKCKTDDEGNKQCNNGLIAEVIDDATCVCRNIYNNDNNNSGTGNFLPTEICEKLSDESPPDGGDSDRDSCRTCLNEDKGVYTAIGCIPIGNMGGLIVAVLGFSAGIGGGITFLLIVYGGFIIMTSAGNPEKTQEGREIITNAIAGLLLIIFSAVILRIIGVDILKIPGFGGTP